MCSNIETQTGYLKMIFRKEEVGGQLSCGVWQKFYLEEHVLFARSQVHLVLVVIHTDVDNVSQQLLIAWDHLQLLVETLHSTVLWSGQNMCPSART